MRKEQLQICSGHPFYSFCMSHIRTFRNNHDFIYYLRIDRLCTQVVEYF